MGRDMPDDKLAVERQETVPPEMNFYRIEALRAASRVVAGALAGGEGITLHFGECAQLVRDADGATVKLAEYLARWLETGER